MEVQNTTPINNNPQPTPTPQPISNPQIENTPMESSSVTLVENVVIDEIPKKKSKGCLTVFLMVLGGLVVLFILLLLTANLWYVSLFKVLFPERSYAALYTQPVVKEISSDVYSGEWTEITFDNLSFVVPFGKAISTDNNSDMPYPNGDIYQFENGDEVVILSRSEEEPGVRAVKEWCLISVSDLESEKSFEMKLAKSFLLIAKAAQIDMTGLQSVPYFYESTRISVCQYGDMNTISEGGVDLVIESNSQNTEGIFLSFQIIITSNSVDQKDIENIIASISFNQ